MSTGLKANSDGSAAIQVGGSDFLTVTSGGNTTFTQAANLPNTFGFKNRIINGAMVIDQRNAGASVTPTSSASAFPVDRFNVAVAQNSKLTAQQSTTVPAGFKNSVVITSSSAYTPLAAGDFFNIAQFVEGFNVADLGWGAAGASTVTLSFWVRSSLTGAFGGALENSAANRCYPFTYTINAANTWEQKTITIAGDTTGTWLTDNGVGIAIRWSMGAGTTFGSGVAGAWSATRSFAPSGSTNLVSTNGATWYVTGVQLEKGSTATSFDYRPYSTELQLAQRYYFKIGPAASGERVGVGYAASAVLSDTLFVFPVIMRTAPTALEQTGTAGDYAVQQAAGATACSAVPTFQTATNQTATTRQTVASGLTTGQGNFVRLQTTSGYFAWSAEL